MTYAMKIEHEFEMNTGAMGMHNWSALPNQIIAKLEIIVAQVLWSQVSGT